MKLALRAALLAAKSLAPLAVIIVLMALFGGTRAQAMDWGSAADVSGDFIQLSTYSVVNYADCEWSYLCGAYVQGQEYVDGRFTGWSQDGDWDVMDAQVVIWDSGSSGSTYTIAGFHYFYNDYLAMWENYEYDTDAVTYVVQQVTPEQPIIGGIYPNSGPAGYDGWIGIYGWYLSGDGSCNVSVTLDGSPVTVTYVSDYQVNVAYSGNSSPLLSLGNKTVQLTTCWGSSAIINDSSDQFTVNGGDPTPSISSVSPTNWSYGQANTVTVQGSGFGTSPDLGFVTPDGIAGFASITNSTDTVINATVPAYHGLVSGSVGVQVFSNGHNGTFVPQHVGQPSYSAMNTTASVFVPDPTPIITSVSPASWLAGNLYSVTLNGSGFGEHPIITVYWPGGGQLNIPTGSVSAFDNHVTSSASFTLSVPDTVPNGPATIILTSEGYLGNCFQGGGGGGGASAQNSANVVAASYNAAVTSGGSAIGPGGVVYISAAPSMPSISATMQASISSYATQWSLTVSYARPDGTGTNTDTFGPSTTTGSAPWSVPWSGNFRGGTAVLSWKVNGTVNGSVSFYILGTNPSNSVIDAAINGTNAPWFFSHMVSAESSYFQFSPGGSPCRTPAGYPCYTNDSGYGLTQATTSNGQDLWNWQGNITAGLSILTSKQTAAYAFQQDQLRQWRDYNSLTTTPFAGPSDTQLGTACLFAYPVRTGTHDYGDANWIKAFNGAASYYLIFRLSPDGSPYWLFSDPADYVYSVCHAPAL